MFQTTNQWCLNRSGRKSVIWPTRLKSWFYSPQCDIVYPQNNWVLPTHIGVTPAKNVIWFSQPNLRVWHLTKKKAKTCGKKECETKRFRNVNNKMVVVTTKRRGDKIEFPPKEVQLGPGSHQLHHFWSHRGNRRKPVPVTLNGPRRGAFFWMKISDFYWF